MQIFPESMVKLWNEWELRVMVLISLSLQIILIMLGNRRKYSTKYRMRIILWLAYLSADWVATISLGVLCSNRGDCESSDGAKQPDNVIMAFWAPFLLLHLGGPDTITAYALEDNELWLRHFLGLLVQVGVAFYVFLRSWTIGTSKVMFIAIPMFITGIIKYGERSWVLWSASSEHFRDSLLPPPDAGPEYVKQIQIFRDEIDELAAHFQHKEIEEYEPDEDVLMDAKIFYQAHYFFTIFRRLYADLIFSLPEINYSYEILSRETPDYAFKLIEIELGFMYDVLYTKASLVYSLAGCILRPISFISTISAFVGFLIVDKQGYSAVNVIISYVLFAGAIVLEIYAISILISSDRTILLLREHKNPILNGINKAICSNIIRNKRWSHSIAQFNLIGYCLRFKPPKINFFRISKKFEKYLQIDAEAVSSELKDVVFQHILKKAQSLKGSSFKGGIEICRWRGNQVLRNYAAHDILGWSVEVDFDESILLWHIATDLCYHSMHDISQNAISDSNVSQSSKSNSLSIKETSKLLSDYMLYLQVMRTSMLPEGIAQIRFQDTVAEAVRFFKDDGLTNMEAAYEKLLQVDSRIPVADVKGEISKSVLFDGCRLAKSLQTLGWQDKRTWEMISNVWVEMLCYGANQCKWNQHAQQLRRGGELLTHVSLLMTHLGLTERLQVFKVDTLQAISEFQTLSLRYIELACRNCCYS